MRIVLLGEASMDGTSLSVSQQQVLQGRIQKIQKEGAEETDDAVLHHSGSISDQTLGLTLRTFQKYRKKGGPRPPSPPPPPLNPPCSYSFINTRENEGQVPHFLLINTIDTIISFLINPNQSEPYYSWLSCFFPMKEREKFWSLFVIG